jgi:twinkle protein
LCTQSVRTLWGSFEICNVRLAKRMLHQFSGVDLDKEPHKFETIADDFEKLFMFFLAFHGQQNVADVLDVRIFLMSSRSIRGMLILFFFSGHVTRRLRSRYIVCYSDF